MNGLAQIVGCLLTYGIAKNTSLALQPWRTLFLICGALTSAAGVLFYILMPNGPKDAWFLTARERQVLSLRMVQDREGGDKTSFSLRQLREALLDPKSWFVFWFGVLVTMQSPVLTVSVLLITYCKMLTRNHSLRPWSSSRLDMTSTRRSCILHHPGLCKSLCCGSAFSVAGSSLEIERWSFWLSYSRRSLATFFSSNCLSPQDGE